MKPVDLARNRRAVAVALLRALGVAAATVVLYFVLPLDRVGEWAPVLPLAAALVGYLALMAYEFRATLRSSRPAARGLQALGILGSLFLVTFAAAYFVMAVRDPGAFSEGDLDRLDALYFTVSTFTTVGFGDITAVSSAARLVVTVQMVLGLVLIGAGVRAILGAVRLAREHRDDGLSPSVSG